MTHHKLPEVALRLARIEGHIHAIVKMIDDKRTYPEIVQQISAVRSSLDGVVQVIIEDLVEGTINAGRSQRRNHALELKQVVARSR